MPARISPEQRIFDSFADLEPPVQASVIAELQKLYRFSVKRDARLTNLNQPGESPRKEKGRVNEETASSPNDGEAVT